MSERLGRHNQEILNASYIQGPIIENDEGEAQLLKGASGEILPFYLAFKQLHEFPHLRAEMIHTFTSLMTYHCPDTEVIGAVQTGGASFAFAVADRLNLRSSWVRSKVKSHGIPKSIDGAAVNGRVVTPIEDIVTSGDTIISDIEGYRAKGAIVNNVIAGGVRKYEAFDRLKEHGVNLITHFQPDQIELYSSGRMFQQDTQLLQISHPEQLFHPPNAE